MTKTFKPKLKDEDIIKIINSKYSKFDYIGGYKNANEFMYLMCKDCGHVFRYTAQIVRDSRDANIQCVECNKTENKIKQARQDLIDVLAKRYNNTIRQYNKKIKEEEREAQRLKYLKEKQIIKQCVECGKTFNTYKKNTVCCSPECSKKRANNRKDRRLKDCDIVDYSITLTKLVKRDKGICYICGKKVNMKADSNSDWYGSIDHVKAIANGGNHTWDNVKLAHRYCNIMKSDNKLFIKEDGQLTMAI
jgi:ribosomal protein S27E